MTAIISSIHSAPKVNFRINHTIEDQWKNRLQPLMILPSDIKKFFSLVDDFQNSRENPNMTFMSINIGENSYHYPTFFHVVYLYWKGSGMQWNSATNDKFESIVDQMLNDRRTDLRATFTEHSIVDSEHFVNAANHNSREEGYSMERMTIAHYAVAIRDLNMLERVLHLDRGLIDSPCCLVKAKALLEEQVIYFTDMITNPQGQVNLDSCDEDDPSPTEGQIKELQNLDEHICGVLAFATQDSTSGLFYYVTRTVRVTPLHLAARLVDEMSCTYLLGKGANREAKDSDSLLPSDYLKASLKEGFVQATPTTTRLFKTLMPVAKLMKALTIKHLPQTHCILKRKGYEIVYNTSTKIAIFAYEILDKNSQEKNSDRKGLSFRVDKDIPKENRASTTDYTNSGFDRGHLVSAADASSSGQAMADTFLLSNITPQNPELNRNYWKRLEKVIRSKVQKHDFLEVFTGGLFLSTKKNKGGKKIASYQVIGKANIAVPTHFFKVIYYDGTAKNRAYILPNENIAKDTPLKDFKVTVNKVQEYSGILFEQWRSS